MVKLLNVSDFCILAVVTLMLSVMSYVTVLVFRIVKFNDWRLLLMLFFLVLTLIGTIKITL